MKKFLTRRNLIVAGVLGVLVLGWWWRGRVVSSQKSEIRTATVTRQDIVETLTVSGKVKGKRNAHLNFLTSGKLAFVNVDEGTQVYRGQALMGLDTGDLLSTQTKAWYAYLAADAYAKQIEDYVKGHDSDETFSQKYSRVSAQTARDAAYETWLMARRAADNAVLKAPFAGVATGVTTLSVGDTVSLTDGVTVVDPKSLMFEVEVDEADLGKVKPGQEADVKLDAYDGQVFKGKVDEIGISSAISSTGATVYLTRINLNSEDLPKLRLGMNGDAYILLGEVKNALSLPIEAVIDGKVELADGKKVEVKTGLSSDTQVEITAGINEGEKVILR